MTTLRERYEASEDFTTEGVLSFFHKELLALAAEIRGKQTLIVKGQMSIEDYEYGNGVNNGISHAATLIRSKANELV